MFPVVFSGLQLSGWSATAKRDSPYLTEMWNTWAKERFLVLRTMSSRKGSFCDISLTQFQLASIFFFLLPLMATQLLAWDGNCFVAPVLLVKSFSEGGMTFALLQWSRASAPEFSILLWLWFLQSKNLTPEHLRLILSQPEPVAPEGGCPALPAAICSSEPTFLHVSQARVFLDTLQKQLWDGHRPCYSIPHKANTECRAVRHLTFSQTDIRFMKSGLWKH